MKFKLFFCLISVLVVGCVFMGLAHAQGDGIPGVDPIVTYPDGNGHYTVVHQFTDGRPPQLLLKGGSLSRAQQVWLDAVSEVRP